MRADDQRDEELSALGRMNYPTFRGAFSFPGELRELITSDGLEFSGRCFERRR